MKKATSLVVATFAVGAFATVWGFRDARAQETSPESRTATDAVDVRVAAFGSEAPVVDTQLPPDCPVGSLFWQRDTATAMCTPVCESDADCVEGLERCAVVALPGAPAAEPILVDDDAAVAAERVEAAHAVALCDPFFDAAAPPSIDQVELAPHDDGP